MPNIVRFGQKNVCTQISGHFSVATGKNKCAHVKPRIPEYVQNYMMLGVYHADKE